MIHSFSSLDQRKKCPFKYAQIRIYQNYKEVFKTRAQLSGKQIHALMQDAVHFNERAVPTEHHILQPVLDDLWACVDMAAECPTGYELFMENEHGVDRKFKPCPYWDKTGRVHYRGAADFYIIAGNTCVLRDIKTGKSAYTEDTQLCDQAVLIKAHHPNVTHINAKYLFTRPGEFFPVINMDEADIERYRKRLEQRIAEEELAAANDDHPPKPTALCNYCIVDNCDHYAGYKPD